MVIDEGQLPGPGQGVIVVGIGGKKVGGVVVAQEKVRLEDLEEHESQCANEDQAKYEPAVGGTGGKKAHRATFL